MLFFNNVFGFVPTKNYEAAGYDFRIPNIDGMYDEEYINNTIIPALSKSFGVTSDQINKINEVLYETIANDRYYFDENDDSEYINQCKSFVECYKQNKWNVLHLYLATTFKSPYSIISPLGSVLSFAVTKFVYENLIFDVTNNVVGVELKTGQTLMINSGIREKLPHNYCGVFLNKSGRGSSGYDMRAQVIDEDYTGYILCNVQFSGLNEKNSRLYCGDKFVQQLILPLYKEEAKMVDSDDYDELVESSKRGESGFGSSNEKH